jgi:hypothetical protein
MKKQYPYLKGIKAALAVFLLLFAAQTVFGQGYSGEIKYLRLNRLHAYLSVQGTEVETGGFSRIHDTFSWPGEYGLIQSTLRGRAIWLGCENFNDPVLGKKLSVKVVGVGPRNDTDRINQVKETEFKLIGRFEHPLVFVDNQLATVNTIYDQFDDLDEKLISERMILVKNHTSMGVTITKKVYQFAQQDHDNYFVYDYVFKNDGIIDNTEEVKSQQTLENFWVHFQTRYAFSGESVPAENEGWGSWNSTWGHNTNHTVIGQDPNAGDFKYRATYAWYQPDNSRPVTFEEDWGCPNQLDDGVMAAAKYSGWITLHADKSTTNRDDDLNQPRTTIYIDADERITQPPYSQYDESFMRQRFDAMTAGHPEMTFAEVVGNNYTQSVARSDGNETPTMGYGPYTLAFSDSIHLVIAEGVAGISREKNREVGGNWVQYYKGSGTPELILPGGSETTDHNAYKRAWVETGVDSIMKMFDHAAANYAVNYVIPQPPPPPETFTVQSGGDRISLSWGSNAVGTEGFDGYVIYRSEGNVMDPKTVYEKVKQFDGADAPHAWDDTTAVRGFDYYYYIQSKTDGSASNGVPLYSSLFWTLTSVAATLQRPAILTTLDSVRVVPNPYDMRARAVQFGEDFQYDRIAFYGLPPVCTVKIFTERGDLIWERYHDDGSGDEIWDSQTRSGQIIVSGIYILYVETPDGRSVIRKFVVIR